MIRDIKGKKYRCDKLISDFAQSKFAEWVPQVNLKFLELDIKMMEHITDTKWMSQVGQALELKNSTHTTTVP